MSASERAASMSPEELIAVVTRGLDADEETAREAGNRRWLVEDNMISLWPEDEHDGFMSWPTRADARHAYRHDPSRVLADVESKRAILADYSATVRIRDESKKRILDVGGPGSGDVVEDMATWDRADREAGVMRPWIEHLARPYLDQETP